MLNIHPKWSNLELYNGYMWYLTWNPVIFQNLSCLFGQLNWLFNLFCSHLFRFLKCFTNCSEEESINQCRPHMWVGVCIGVGVCVCVWVKVRYSWRHDTRSEISGPIVLGGKKGIINCLRVEFRRGKKRKWKMSYKSCHGDKLNKQSVPEAWAFRK